MTLLNYATWNCSSSYGIEDENGVSEAIMDTTCLMVDIAVKYVLDTMFILELNPLSIVRC